MSTEGSPAVVPARGHGQRILYLDDEEPLVFLVTRMLRQLGYKPSGFTNAADALAAFRNNPKQFALVLTDLTMPGTSGMDFARQVLSVSADAPIVVVSGCLSPEDVVRAKSLGVRALIQKPSTVEELGESIQRLLSAVAAGARA